MTRLLELAKKRFPDDWTDADERLFRQTAMGLVADYGDGDPAEADKWGDKRVLRADRIEWLCTDREAIKEVTHRGVWIKGARIEGRPNLSYAKIDFPLAISYSAIPRGMVMQRCRLYALFLNGTRTGPINADGLRVEHDLHMRDGFHATGEVRLVGATIGSDLSCIDGHFSKRGEGGALSADGIVVSGSVYLRDGFGAEGDVVFSGANVGRSFQWWGVKDRHQCTLYLESAKFGILWDEENSWPAKLYLDGLVYDRLYGRAPTDTDSEARLRWLERQGYDKKQFVPQPYVQLAKVLQEMGHEADARRILIAKQKDPARVAAMTWYFRPWHHLLGVTICYGYRPWQAALWIAGFILLGSFLFCNGADSAQFQEIGGDPPAFNTFVYSLDSFIPLIDLHQAKYRLPTGAPLRVYLWLHIGFGWLLTTLLVVGLTGLVRK